MSDPFQDLPERIAPYIRLTRPDEPISLPHGHLRLTGTIDAQLDADLRFRWSPSAQIEFEGTSDKPLSLLPRAASLEDDWSLVSERDTIFTAPVLVTNIINASAGKPTRVRGIVARSFTIGGGPFEALRFCLANFPSYTGKAIRYEVEGQQGAVAGRLEMRSEDGCLQIDKIPEAQELIKKVERDAGFVISHVGLWAPSSGTMSAKEAESLLTMLHFWFGVLRGAWTGPLFPQGINATSEVVWRQLASWRLRTSQRVPTWLPERRRPDLSAAFQGFAQRWNDPAWRDPLLTAVSWLVEANAPEASNESRIVLARMGLELFSWVLLVERQHLHHHNDFEGLSAAGRIRALLHHIGVPTALPGHLRRLQALHDRMHSMGLALSPRYVTHWCTPLIRRDASWDQSMASNAWSVQSLHVNILN